MAIQGTSRAKLVALTSHVAARLQFFVPVILIRVYKEALAGDMSLCVKIKRTGGTLVCLGETVSPLHEVTH